MVTHLIEYIREESGYSKTMHFFPLVCINVVLSTAASSSCHNSDAYQGYMPAKVRDQQKSQGRLDIE